MTGKFSTRYLNQEMATDEELSVALSSKEDTANKDVPNGYAGLDSSGKVPSESVSISTTNHNRVLQGINVDDPQKLSDFVDDWCVTLSGEPEMQGSLQWQKTRSTFNTTITNKLKVDQDSVIINRINENTTVEHKINISATSIQITNDNNPAMPVVDEDVVVKKYVDDKILSVKYTDLADTDSNYVAKARYIPTVNDSETGLELVERRNLFVTEELIANPSFEDWPIANSMPDFWEYGGTGSAATNIQKETVITFNGGTSLILKNLTATYSNRSFTSDVYQVPATGTLITKIYAYLPTTPTPASDVRFRISVSFFNDSMTPIQTITNTAQQFLNYETWISFIGTVTIPSGAAFAETTIQANRAGSALTRVIFDFASTVVSSINVPNNVSDLKDVQIVNPLNNQVLIYDDVGSVWRNQTQTHQISDVNGLQTTLNNKIGTSEKGVANGVVPLNAQTKIDAIYLPSYVDDVLEFANLSSFPSTGETGKIYVSLDTNSIYRWSGSTYIELTDDTAVWGSISGALSNQADLQNALNGKENTINSSTFNRFLSTTDNTAQLAFQKVNDLALSKNGESNLSAEFTWANEIPGFYTNYVKINGNRLMLNREFVPGGGVTKTIEIAPDGIRFLNGSSPATPQYPETLVPKKYVDDIAVTKENTANKNLANGYAGLNANSEISPSTLPFKILGGPGQLVQFSGTAFTNSGYTPGVQVNSTPSNFGFYPVQNASFVFNPFAILGANKNYRIYAIKRQDGAFNDGLHCMIRKVENGSESGIPGLLDWGAGVNTNSGQLSSVLNSGTTNSFMWFRCYFAAYNGGNGATIQDLTLWIVTE
jgi:hypothetical protein